MKRKRKSVVGFVSGILLLGIFSCWNLGIEDGGMIIDHNSADASEIPDRFISDVFEYDIYFEHASVGVNIMSGFTSLAVADSRYDIPHTDSNFTDWFAVNNGIGDNSRGNNNPLWKADFFETSMTTDDFAESLHIAMYKLCYIDIQGTASEAFQYTVDTMTDLESAYPGTVFVWWTMPIMDSGSERRDDFNNMIRDYCRENDKWLFDIADLERHFPDGSLNEDASGFELLCGDDDNIGETEDDYSADGGHLNSFGSERMANALWVLFAKIAGWNG